MFQRLPGKRPAQRCCAYKDLCFICAMTATPCAVRFTSRPGARSPNLDPAAASQATRPAILTALVYVADMAQKDEMTAPGRWADRNNPPVRACLGVTLTGDSLVEIVATAARG